MRSAFVLFLLILSASCAVNTVESQKRAGNDPIAIPNPPSKQPVLVELFTSEG